MDNLPINYPLGSSDEEIYDALKGISTEIMSAGGNVNSVMKWAPLAQLGQNELQKRLADKAIRNSEKAERIAIWLSAFSVTLTIVAIGLAYLSFKSDDEWKKAETQLLTSINTNLATSKTN